MALLPSLKRLAKQDIPGAPGWVDSLLLTVNNFMQTIFGILAHNLTFEDNFKCQIAELAVAGDLASATIGLKAVDLAKGVLFLGYIKGKGYAVPTAPVAFTWEQLGTNVEITGITGLVAGERYSLRFLVV